MGLLCEMNIAGVALEQLYKISYIASFASVEYTINNFGYKRVLL